LIWLLKLLLADRSSKVVVTVMASTATGNNANIPMTTTPVATVPPTTDRNVGSRAVHWGVAGEDMVFVKYLPHASTNS
jgi:hypothetical protein